MMYRELALVRSGGGPLHRQIADGLARWARGGVLSPGTRLPPSRELARVLGVNRGTVQKAYGRLVSTGFARARVGQGTFITGAPGRSFMAETPFAFEARATDAQEWERLARRAARPGVISLAGGMPDARLVPVAPFRDCLNAVLDEEGTDLLQYGASRGHPRFLDFLSRHLEGRGLLVSRDRILVVSGSQQGLDLVGRALISPGDRVVVEDPTYSGALALFRMLGARLLAIPMDGEGMQVDRLEAVLSREQPRLVYTIPTFHNPTGQTLSKERRAHLLQICAAAGVPVIEDDSDGELRFEGADLPPLAAAAAAGGIIYMGTFSKLFFPGLRLGWVMAEPGTIQRLEATKRVTDLHTAPLLQAAMARFAESAFFHRLARQIRSRYRARRDAMLAALDARMPEGVRWTRPQGGLSLMLDLPPGLDSTDLLAAAIGEGVVFAPGHLFSAVGGGRRRLRLTYGHLREEEISEGVARLARAVSGEMRGESGREEETDAVPALPPV
ncbi:MAG: PLP-dependent aminotransferase family protein [Acidobacteriota bacterium]